MYGVQETAPVTKEFQQAIEDVECEVEYTESREHNLSNASGFITSEEFSYIFDNVFDSLNFYITEPHEPGYTYERCNHIAAGGAPTQMIINDRKGYEVAPKKITNVGKPIKEEKKPKKTKTKSLKRMLKK